MKATATLRKKKSTSKKKDDAKSFTIVAIGASVGGLDAMTTLLRNLPANTGMAYIYVQHLNPDHKSFLTSILSKITKMKVQVIENMEHMLPNNVYVIPHDKGIEVTDGHIKLIPRSQSASAISIDVLFSSLALTHKKDVIGVVLSGNASDGTRGLKAIKSAGGITFAQDDSAQASSMPQSAIATGVVDFVLSPKEIARKLVQFCKSGFPHFELKGREKELMLDDNSSDLKSVFELLHRETGVDFTHYKMPTIKRRLNHKMQQGGVKTVKDYIKLLQKDKHEVDELYSSLLINVTSFFRDAEAFRYLKSTFLPKLIKSKKSDETLRLWIPACSSGEEAYSIAMLIAENQEKQIRKISIQIFATDLSEQSIQAARLGEYTVEQVKSVPKKYMQRFFAKTGDNYRIAKEIREMCVFAPHNILRDPPFSRMDFISCCNLLIYFDAAAQKKVFATMHFALNEKGFLMLGKAESVGTSSSLFTRTSNRFKIYSRKKNTGIAKILELTPQFSRALTSNKKSNFPTKTISPTVNPTAIENAIDIALLLQYMPACVVVNKEMEILQFRGPVSSFLIHAPGKASLNILKMARSEFAYELRSALNQVIKTKQPVFKSGIEMEIESVFRLMSFEVRPLKNDWDDHLMLIVFTKQEPVEKFEENGKGQKNNTTQKDLRLKKLTEELNNVRAEMNSIIESQETTYEELQAANEEIVSTNEEFQTLNEELETSKEEIQASNEELLSTNHELQMRNDLLTESYDYSEAIIATNHEPMLVLNKDFQIKSANRSYYKKFLTKKEDTEGKRLFELGNHQWDIPKLRESLITIFSKNSSFENLEVTQTVAGVGQITLLLNARLILQKSHNEDLILLAFADITEVRQLAISLQVKENKTLSDLLDVEKKASKRIEESEKGYRNLIQSLPVAVYTCDKNGFIQLYNKAAVELWGREPEIGKEKWCGSWQIFNLDGTLIELEQCPMALAIKEQRNVVSPEIIVERENGEKRFILPNPRLIFDQQGKVTGSINTLIDVTDQKLISRYSLSLLEASLDPLVTINSSGKITDMNEATVNIMGIEREKLIGSDFSTYFLEAKKAKEMYQSVFVKGSVVNAPLTLRNNKGKLTDVLFNGSGYKDDRGNVMGAVMVARDVTEQKRIATELIEAKVFAELATEIAEEAKNKAESATRIAEDAVKAKQQFLSNMSHEIRTPMNAIIGFTKVVLKTELSTKQKEYLTAIKMSGDALIVLINDILDLAKVDAGKMTFEKTPFKLMFSISAMLHLFETKIQEKNLELVKEYDERIPEMLLGDPVRLHQIILNLISNAVKFTNRGSITIRVHLLKEDSESATIEFAVQDTGIGIAENKIKNIFENFQQASSDTSRLYGGTGLGLAIVKQLVEQQGGSVQVRSNMEEGSTFSFVLSFQKTNVEAERPIDVEETETQIKHIKVLVVEDIALNQLLMKTVLDDFGFERDIAGNGKLAIEKLQEKSYDIILMDLQMPEMNGFEATEYIRNTMHSKIPIIALTADVTTVDLAKCKSVGMNDYIAKPIDEKLLYGKIVGLVKKSVTAKDRLVLAVAPAKESQKTAYIDLTYLTRLTKADPKLLVEMITIYLEQTPSLISSMMQSLNEHNWPMLQSAVHKMIPSFSIMGFDPEMEVAARKVLEFIHAEKSLEEIPDLILQLESVCVLACGELETELKRMRA